MKLPILLLSQPHLSLNKLLIRLAKFVSVPPPSIIVFNLKRPVSP